MRITFVSTWPKVPDGLATFCEQLATHLPGRVSTESVDWDVVQIIRFPQLVVKHKSRVVDRIVFDDPSDYRRAAETLNQSNTDLVVIQFVNFIYGDFGRMLFELLDRLDKPVLIILHTVPTLSSQERVAEKRDLLMEFKRRNIPVVTQSDAAKTFLIEKLGFESAHVSMLYHPAPKFQRLTVHKRNRLRRYLHIAAEAPIVFTYGILRKDKGIEDLIEAFPLILEYHPTAVLLILGTDQENGSYIRHLKQLIQRQGLARSVVIKRRYLTEDEIGSYLQLATIFVTAQHNVGLHSSGTLAYALSAGSMIVSTPTIHAQELLANAGVITPERNSPELAATICRLLDSPETMLKHKVIARRLGASIYWNVIAKAYAKVFLQTIRAASKSK